MPRLTTIEKRKILEKNKLELFRLREEDFKFFVAIDTLKLHEDLAHILKRIRIRFNANQLPKKDLHGHIKELLIAILQATEVKSLEWFKGHHSQEELNENAIVFPGHIVKNYISSHENEEEDFESYKKFRKNLHIWLSTMDRFSTPKLLKNIIGKNSSHDEVVQISQTAAAHKSSSAGKKSSHDELGQISQTSPIASTSGRHKRRRSKSKSSSGAKRRRSRSRSRSRSPNRRSARLRESDKKKSESRTNRFKLFLEAKQKQAQRHTKSS
jgi:hypothetical protein